MSELFRYTGPNAAFCPHCGVALKGGEAYAGRGSGAVRRPSMVHRVLQLGLIVWPLGYPVISCSPLRIGSANGGSAGGAAALAGLSVGTVLLVPWLIGVLVLSLLTALSR